MNSDHGSWSFGVGLSPEDSTAGAGSASPAQPQGPGAAQPAGQSGAGGGSPATPPDAPVYQWTPPPPFEYAAPVFSDLPQEVAAASPSPMPAFSHSGRLAVTAQALIGLAGMLALFTAIHFILGADLQGRLQTGRALQSDADAFNGLTITMGWTALVLELVAGIAFIRWQWRSMVNSIILGANPYATGSPRASVIAWCVPILNLFRPYQFVADLHDRLLAPLESSSGRWLLRLWWTFWLTGTVVSWFVAFGLAQFITAGSTANRLEVMVGEAIVAGLVLADAILAIAVIGQIQRLSDARLVARQGDPNRAIHLIAESQRRQVTHLPFTLAAVAILAIAIPAGLAYAGANTAQEWAQFTPPDGAFMVSMPGKPLEQKTPAQLVGNLEISGDVFRAGVNSNLVFTVTYEDYPTGSLSSIPPATAYNNVTAALEQKFTIDSRTEITIGGKPAYEIKASATNLDVMARFVVVGDRMYIAEADSTPAQANSPDVRRFLDSFTVR